jgi:hypothetical protein
MSFLTLNGIAIAVSEGHAKKSAKEIGDRADAFDGTPLLSRQRIRREYEVDSVPLVKTEAWALENFVLGAGHHWSFDSHLYSSKGLGPNVFTGTTAGSVAGKYGNKLTLAATTGQLNYPAAVAEGNGDSTVLVFRFESGAWHHYIVRSDGSRWYDGVLGAGGATASWLTVSPAGSVTLTNSTVNAQDYDDLVALPFKIPDSWVAGLYAYHAAQAFSDLRRLTMGGDFVQATVSVVGELTGDSIRKATISGTKQATRSLSFKLTEV